MTSTSAEPRPTWRAPHPPAPAGPASAACGVSSFAARGWRMRRPTALPLLPMTQARVRPEPAVFGTGPLLAGAAALGALWAWAIWRRRDPRA